MELVGLTSELRDCLLAGTGKPPLDVALELVGRAGAAGLAILGAMSIDRRLAPHQRMTVLLAISVLLALTPETPPAEALDAVEDEETAATAIRSGYGAALTGVLAAAPRGGSLDATRRLLGRRLVAAGERGPHVAQLLLDAGDRVRAAQLAADDLAQHLATHAEPTLETWARLRILLDWSSDDALLDAVLQQLATQHPALLARLEPLLVRIPDAEPAAVQRVRSTLVWLLNSR
ncbi:MAG TPA: hypothetical protein VFV99_26385 [Kofleriaceae bacterium]|nr:hypothetical protein [Kofleriaceae bacterium]